MSIVAASHESSVLSAALAYLELGLSVVPVKGKVCPVQWAKFQTQLAPFSYVHNWHRNGLMTGVAIVGGKVSGNLVFMDLDGLEAVAHYERCFPHLLDTYTVVTGSGNGKHFYYFVDKLPATTRTKGYELRSDGCYVVAPPSLHPVTGREYIPNRTEIKRVDNLDEIVTWIMGMIRAHQPARVESDKPSMMFENSTAYGQSALDSAVRNVAAAGTRNRNNALYIESLKLGSLVRDGCLTVSDVESALLRAAAAVGLVDEDGERQCLNTIRSGLRTGMKSSRREWKR